MRHSIADSDGEDDEILVADHAGTSESGVSAGEDAADASAAAANSNEATGKSTGSTERLRREIVKAELGLASMKATAQNASGSPSTQAQKRRHTAALGVESSFASEPSAKRTKTLKTYGTGRQTHMMDDAGWLEGPTTSQSFHFSEHSGAASSAALPAGSMGEDFLNHEPHVMFLESGSTVADHSSVEQQLLEQARQAAMGAETPAINVLKSDTLQSSSLPFSPFEQGDSANSGGKHSEAENGQAQNATQENEHSTHQADEVSADAREIDEQQAAGQTSDLSYVTADAEPPAKIGRSPTVEIERHESLSHKTTRRDSVGSESRTKDRKRKAQPGDGSSDPLNSDDKAIGLPKELYQPRPSRRRATQVPEEPIDYGIRPEKAAKNKRIKSTGAALGTASFKSSASESRLDQGATKTLIEQTTTMEGETEAIEEQPPAASSTKQQGTASSKHHSSTEGHNEEMMVTQQSTTSSKGIGATNEDAPFVKPARPAPKSKGKSKSKRAQTTIFEDLVEFTGSQRSPSLSQQQAKRNSALAVVHIEATKGQKKRKIVDSDDEEDGVDETSAITVEEDSPPKKRGRGRPAKAAPKAQPKSSEKVTEDPEDNDGVEEQPEIDQGPQKRGRGRPKTAVETPAAQAVPEVATHEKRPNPQPEQVPEEVAAAETGPTESASVQATEMPTPSPEKENVAQKTTKPSPISHSPIKSSSAVPLRVGLNKRHRIPSLLKIARPAKQ